MELAPCNEYSRQLLVNILDRLQSDAKQAEYIVKLFPNVLLDLARQLIEQATRYARQPNDDDPAEAIKQQLKPFFVFGFLLGNSPQITSLMYTYFEQSSFQPLPEEFFKLNESPNGTSLVDYTYPAFNDELVRDILKTYFKYLVFNPKLFSSVWNWSELGRIVALHPNHDLRYLATCNLSIITRPNRHQHLSMLHDVIDDKEMLIDLQIKYCPIYDNHFTPLIESNQAKREEFLNSTGRSHTGYEFDSQTLAKVTNILLLKHDISTHSGAHSRRSDIKAKIEHTIKNFIPVKTLHDAISKSAYATSINRPCLIRGPPGCGKTSMIDYIAAQTNRVEPPVYVKVQVGDQIDSKLLVGSYVCTEIPGQFEWQPGPLMQAMAYGSWIVFEDIDLAPSEMAQVIHSVIENGNLSCVACCPIKMDSPHPDFRIFFTQRTRDSAKSMKLGFGFVERLCTIVDVPQLTRDDLKEIISKRYSFAAANNQDLAEKVIQLHEMAEKLARETNLSRAPRLVTLKDLFKFCDRISSRKMQQSSDGKYSQNDLDAIMSDAIDCFIAFLPEKTRVKVAETLGQIINKPADEIHNMLLQRKPEVRVDSDSISVGRARLDVTGVTTNSTRSLLANTRQSVQLLESVSLCIKNREPVLLVGETGVGKTTIVQHLSKMMKTELVILNLSQQSDSSDLLGGYCPVEMREVMQPINERFFELFRLTFDSRDNRAFLEQAEQLFLESKWKVYLGVICSLCGKGLDRTTNKEIYDKWRELQIRTRRLSKRIATDRTTPMALSFAEGTLLRAVRKGRWILLDEINLAEPDVLQCLLLILDSLKDSYIYMQGADQEKEGVIKIHPNFRIFACMNPSTDIGKRDLPVSTRARFTEFFVDDVLERHELRLIVESYVKTCLNTIQIENIVKFYQELRERANSLSDISGNSPVYSLRTLCRALTICAQNVCRNMEKSLFESLMITFLQQLNEQSVAQVLRLIESLIFKNLSIAKLNDTPIQMPQDSHQYLQIETFWIQTSSQKKINDENYIITSSVRENLKRICRIISLGQRKLPILIQGNTSVGKTSLIKHLARMSGNLCFRINNHEHTDLQDYFGRYVLRESGELQFQEGLLVTAMRKGYWVILDELNLAPCDLLEALNRVLDDNRELFIPETRELIRAHSKFMLFATQNPPEEYAGRKILSRAFRNRFIELNFDEIPSIELEEILHKRCKMPPQYAKKIVLVMKELQVFRRESGCFSGKNSFMTMRDLFRWGERYSAFMDTVADDQTLDWEEFLATEGLILLEGKVRTLNEADTVKSIIEKVFKKNLKRTTIYNYDLPTEIVSDPKLRHVQLTDEYKKIFVQLSHALRYNEPVLLCGQTGCGKTTACQIYAKIMNQELLTYNCHLNTECSDFVGNVRPARQADEAVNGIQKFPWVDGPLVQAMRKGSIFLMDEISLADDAVLERINSVLEPERSITLTEKDGEEVAAQKAFRFVATMNPGGDYGKKELSPALRNRFTEIYCHNPMDIKQIMCIIESALSPSLLKPKISPRLIPVLKRFLKDYYRGQSIISLRDVLNWTQFLNRATATTQIMPLTIQQAIIDGVSLIFFDQFGTCGHKASHTNSTEEFKRMIMNKLERLVYSKFGKESLFADKVQYNSTPDNRFVKFGHYCVLKGPLSIADGNSTCEDFVFDAPTVNTNALKIIRALNLDRPILLEGDPGAGKTSIVSALARKTGYKLTRINLSEQTDIGDLFGSDLPDASNPDDDSPKFCWHDGPLLRAIKESSWVLLDEMNLASQSVLEGLNACFDHRGEIFIPELNKRFVVDRSSTRIFACQNPYDQGAARKGLPQSFLNRFTSIYVESHTSQDLSIILRNLYPSLSEDIIEKMIIFNSQLNAYRKLQGYEFNLRDMIYWCNLTTRYVKGDDFKKEDLYDPGRFVQFVYIDRLRSLDEKVEISDLFEKIFGYPVYEPLYRELKLGEFSFLLSRAILQRKNRPPPHLFDLCILKYQMPYLESIGVALESGLMPILVGESGTGKRSMVRILAGLTGNNLNIISANREMDTVELLGSYEQKSLQREIVDLVQDANKFVTSLVNSIPHRAQDNSWTQLYKHMWSTLYATTDRDFRLSNSEIMDAYRFQLNQMKELISHLQPMSINTTENMRKDLKNRIRSLTRKLLYHSESTYSSGNFEWIDSVLIKSIKEGGWLMIENANLMNPATLDRLNSLIEPNGCLSLNEKGAGEDGIEILKPHPDFRLILTMNPEHGELSRAMRNRGAEIYVRTRFYFEDFLMLLKQNGFKPQESLSCLSYCIMQTCYDTHLKITDEEAEQDGSLLAYFGLNHLSSMAQQIRRGVLVDEILANLLTSYYHQKGYLEIGDDESITAYVFEKMRDYRKKYVVDLNDERYKWCYFMHDLVSMTGGDANLAMLVRETRLFWDTSDPVANGLLKTDEIVDCLDIVNTCTTVKIFMELSTQDDFEYRKGFIKDTFMSFPKFTKIVNRHVNSLHQDCMPLINSQMPYSDLIPLSEMYVDTRNSPDLQYYLQAIDYKGSVDREDMQNRWVLSLYRITIKMIVDLIESRTLETPGNMSLWQLAERVRTGEMLREDLIRHQAEIAVDLHDFLLGILRVVGDRCFDNSLVPKMLARFFWISYLLCKLKRGYTKMELVAICNQLPMLWSLTYQKIIVPLIKDCDLADLTFNYQRFSDRMKQICNFFGVTITKPSHIERFYYNKVVNLHAATSKRCEMINREIDKFFGHLLGRYTKKAQSMSLGSDNIDVLAASGLIWSNSPYLITMYRIQDMFMSVELAHEDFDSMEKAKAIFNDAKKSLVDKKNEYDNHEARLMKEQYRTKLLGINRRRNALDQFAPVWQVKFLQIRLSLLNTQSPKDALNYRESLRQMLHLVNGVIISPRYYGTLMKFFRGLDEISMAQNIIMIEADTSLREKTSLTNDSKKTNRRYMDMYATFLVDHIMENIVLDHQVVGWTKLRVTTCDLCSSAPLIPEYSPIISFVGSYCLDVTHLRLNSYQRSSPQLDSMLIYLWRAYALIKNDPLDDLQDIALAKNLIHLLCSESEDRKEIIGDHECPGPNAACACLEAYINRRRPNFNDMLRIIRNQADQDDADVFEKSIKLIHFGFYSMLEFAPIFTLDPSLRSREKLEVYNSELAHIKLDLHQRNTLYYWKTGENFRLVEITPEEAKMYPFTVRVLVERRNKLEKSIKKLRKEYTNRPKSDDGTQYEELKKEVQVTIRRYTAIVESLVGDISAYLGLKKSCERAKRLVNLNTKCRMLIRSIETTIKRFKFKYVLYADLTTYYTAGLCFILQGLRRLYSRLEPKMQLSDLGFNHASVRKFSTDIMRVFSFNEFTLNNLESVANKRALYSILAQICPKEKISHVQSLLLRSILIQLNHHIIMTPSDIKQCIPIVQNVADKFHLAWLERKKFLEEQRHKQEDLYQYKQSVTSLGNEISYERREFIEICTKFPIYDHVYQDSISSFAGKLSADEENLATEAKIINLNRSVDLTMCIDVCKAHYKFMKEASLNLLDQQESIGTTSNTEPINIEMNQLIKLEAEILYTIIRQCAPNFDKMFDSLSLECHLLQANELTKMLKRESSKHSQVGSLSSSIEILDEEIFDIYHNADVREALRLQELMSKIDNRVNMLRSVKGFEAHHALNSITRLTSRISSFLMTEPMMKFVTGAHMLLQYIDDWNQKTSREYRLTGEFEELIDLIKMWREIEVKSWRSSLHRVKKKYIDDALCDLWFELYESFNDPAAAIRKRLIEEDKIDENVEISPTHELFYEAFSYIIKQFFEKATLGDYQIRLDLVFSFAIQTRFSCIYDLPRSSNNVVKRDAGDSNQINVTDEVRVDYEKLTTYVYNLYRQYQGLMEPLKERLTAHETRLKDKLTEKIRIVNWQGLGNAWDIKTNFRISHKRLNDVMNEYLGVLRQTISQEKNDVKSENFDTKIMLDDKLPSEMLLDQCTGFENVVNSISCLSSNHIARIKHLTSLTSAPNVIQRMRELSIEIFRTSSKRYVRILKAVEESMDFNMGSMENFHSHKVQSMVINPKDSKEVRDEKMKTCRQMYHSKKFAMQAIFKNLQLLGVSYQRGINNSGHLDKMILSLEPLRGMIQNRSCAIMKAASELVYDSLVTSCNELYRQVVTNSLYMLTQEPHADLTSDQAERMKGYTFDMLIDILKHSRNAAMIYRHLMDIQASSTRLKQLQKLSEKSDRVIVYNFAKVHEAIQRFDELIGRTVSSFSKLDLLMECCQTYSDLWNLGDGENPIYKDERTVLKDLIGEIDERNALMTQQQFDHMKQNLAAIRKDVAKIGAELRDKLKHSIKSHFYGEDDIKQLQNLFSGFIKNFSHLFSSESESQANLQRGTILGSMSLLLDEAKHKVAPILDNLHIDSNTTTNTDIEDMPNVSKLNIRLQKLIRQTKLVSQDIYKNEMEFVTHQVTSESEKRKMKPFNHIDSSRMRDLLRPQQVSKQIANCFMTINLEGQCNIEKVVCSLEPILSIYTHNMACYLNVILSSLRSKLLSANQLIPFFNILLFEGFGLPCSIQDLSCSADGKSSADDQKSSEDNTGFGEGQGETDASEKLDYESQLDELHQNSKRDENEGENGQPQEEESIKPSDDGVEMTTDFDAKAQGPEQDSGDNQDDVDDNYSDNQDLEQELEKQFDQVDEDEGHLDKQLWDEDNKDDDEQLGEDDEADLREADVDKAIKPEIDDIDLMAKDENLKQSTEATDDRNKEANAKDDLASGNDDDVESISEIDENLFKDSAAKDTSDMNESVENNDDELPQEITESVEMEDDESNLSDNVDSKEFEEITLDDDDSGEQDSFVDSVSKADDGKDASTMNDDVSEEIPIESDGMDQDESRQGGVGKMDVSENDDSRDGSNLMSKDKQQSAAIKSDGDEDDDEGELNEQQVDTVKQGDGGEQLGDQQTDVKDAAAAESTDDMSGKRTFAQRGSLDKQGTVKRQKIEAAITHNEQKKKDNPADTSKAVRHLERDSSNAIDVIDLVSDSDDELLLNADQLEECIETDNSCSTRKPKGVKDQNSQPGTSESPVRVTEEDDDQKENAGSSYNTNLGLLKYITHSNQSLERDTSGRTDDDNLMEEIDKQLNMEKSSSVEHESIETDKLTKLWSECSRSTNHLVHELCQQLQIVLQPTKMSKYRGDYKTGKRLNMRKIISYIASHYRKDKIWLRRTKPSKRTYNISLAVDNSSSMSENNCRSMTYQSLALLAHSLSLIEAGSLNVVKFGEQVQCIHEFGQPYMDAIGAQWLKELRFNEKRTSYSKMLKFCCEAFAKQAQQTTLIDAPNSANVHQLLVVISDGRNVTSEQEEVKCCLRHLKSLGVLTLFVIIDDLKQNSGKSIVDVKSCIHYEGSGSIKGGGLRIESYMDVFPFPFYVLLRQIETMPSVLGDALRQWFEKLPKTYMMQNRSKVINKLALVLLSIVVLELMLIGDRVQPIKAIKKKILVKKLKKILPLLALIKPKKKVILVPIPIPMFNKHAQSNQYGPTNNHHQTPMMMSMNTEASSQPPASFVMTVLNNNEPNVGSAGPTSMPTQTAMTPSGSMMMEMVELPPQASPAAMLVPSMTMTIQSADANGSGATTTTAIEMSSSMGNATSGALMALPKQQQRLPATRGLLHQKQRYIEQHTEPQQQVGHLDWTTDGRTPGGEYYYSSPWATKRPPLASPAKLLRGERTRTQPASFRPQQQQRPPTSGPVQLQTNPVQQQNQRLTALAAKHQPVIIIRNQWRPSSPVQSNRMRAPPNRSERLEQQPLEQQHVSQQQLDMDEFVPVGPPQLMPIYQTANGEFHMTPPPPAAAPAGQATTSPTTGSSFEHEDAASGANQSQPADSVEVQTIGSGNQQGSTETSGFQSQPPLTSGQLSGNSQASNSVQLEHERLAASRPQLGAKPVALKGSKEQQPSGKRKQPPASGAY